MGVHCVSTTKLEKDVPKFFEEIKRRWDLLSNTRAFKVSTEEKEKKRQKALGGCEDDTMSVRFSAIESHKSYSQGRIISSPEDAKTMPYSFLPSGEKCRLREDCQAAWDLAFVICGIPFAAADNPVLRMAIEKTRKVPDFRLACKKTMRTSRLVKLNDNANQYKELRLKAGERYGFAITSDGWRSVAKRNYHNYILLSVEGAIFISMEETTGAGGTGHDVEISFKAQFDKLGPEITQQVILGVTDTPSANRKSWRLLEARYPTQLWVGCGAHEVSLLFKEWVKKVPEILQLYRDGHRVVKWINNHADLLKLFRDTVPSHFNDKRKHSIGLYTPGDTRMATVFKMLHRIQVLAPVLVDLVGSAAYENASQKALKAWSDQQPAGSKLVTVGGKYVDKVKHIIQDSKFMERIGVFINSTKSALYLLRLVDRQTPVIGKFYYCCALVDKHLRVLKEAQSVPYIDQMRSIFMKRWKRWHRPVHTFAYAVDPCYQEHELSREEKADCLQVRLLLPFECTAYSAFHLLNIFQSLIAGDEKAWRCELAQAESGVRSLANGRTVNFP